MITFQPKTIDVFMDIGSDFSWAFQVPNANDFDFYGTMSRNYQAVITKVFNVVVDVDGYTVNLTLSNADTSLIKPDQYEYELRKKHKVTGEVSRVATGNLIATGNQFAWGST